MQPSITGPCGNKKLTMTIAVAAAVASIIMIIRRSRISKGRRRTRIRTEAPLRYIT